MKHLKTSNINGLSGHIEFDQATGYRKNLTVDIVDMTRSGLSLVGHWYEFETNPDKSIKIVRSYEKEKIQTNDKLTRHLIVTTKLVSLSLVNY